MYPLLKGNQSHYPTKEATGGCSFCEKSSTNGFVGFSAGALQAGPSPNTFFPLNNGIAWFDLFDHGVTKNGEPLQPYIPCFIVNKMVIPISTNLVPNYDFMA